MGYENFQRMQALDTESSLGAKSLEGLRAGVRAAGEWHDEVVQARAEKSPLACQAGCSSCCWLPASATLPELVHLAAFVIESFTPEALGALKVRLAEDPAGHAGPARAGDATPRRACALLVEGLCTAHAARPLACRGWNSTDAEPCRIAFEEPDSPPSIPVDSRVHGTARAISEGIREGVRRLELDDSVLDLRAGLLLLLDDLAGCTRDWLEGRRLPGAMQSSPELSVRLGDDGRWRTRTPETPAPD